MMGILGIIAFLLIAFGVRSYVSNEVLSKRPSRLDQFYFGALITFIVIWLFSNSPFYNLLDYNRYIPFKEFASEIKLQTFLSHVYKYSSYFKYQFGIVEILKSLLKILGTLLPITFSFHLLQVQSQARRILYSGLILGLLVITYSGYSLGTLVVLYLTAHALSIMFKMLIQKILASIEHLSNESNPPKLHFEVILKVIPFLLICCFGLYISWPMFTRQFDFTANTASYQDVEIQTKDIKTTLSIPSENFSMSYVSGVKRENNSELNLKFNVEQSPEIDFPYRIESRSIGFLIEINGETQNYGGHLYTDDFKLGSNSDPSKKRHILDGPISLSVNHFSADDFKPIPIKSFKLLGIQDIGFVITDANLLDQFEIVSAQWIEDTAGYPNYEVIYRLPNDSDYEFNWYIHNFTYSTDAFFAKMSNKLGPNMYVERQELNAYSDEAILVSENEFEKIYRTNYYYYDQYQGVLNENDIESIVIKPVTVYYKFWTKEALFDTPLVLDFTE